MSCLVTKGRLLPCKEFIGGLYKVWFANYGTFTPTVDANNVVTSLSGVTIYEYELKGTSKLEQTMTSSRENGTTFVTQTLTLDLTGGDYNFNNEVKLMAYGHPYVIVQDNYGSAWFAGRLRGMDVTAALQTTGGAISDKYGYTITLVGTENEYANFLSGSTITNAFGSMTIQPTIVKGT